MVAAASAYCVAAWLCTWRTLAHQVPGRVCCYLILKTCTRRLEWRTVLKMIVDTARGMAFLHSAKPSILHRDLKVCKPVAAHAPVLLCRVTPGV